MQAIGTTISFASGFCAKIIKADTQEMKREAIKTSHFGTADGFHTFVPSDLADPGGLDVELQFNPSATPPITSPAETVTLSMKKEDGTTVTWSFQGFMTGYKAGLPLDGLSTCTCTIKASGKITFNGGGGEEQS